MRRLSLMAATRAKLLTPRPPDWVVDLIEGIDTHRSPPFTLHRAAIARADTLGGTTLAAAVTSLYKSLAGELAAEARHPVRIWNFVPDIQGALDHGDRYMSFNRGRFNAYRDWFGGLDAFSTRLPTASAVGVLGTELIVFALAADAPGQPIENPRQIPSYRYSRRYGPRPPCFARATRLGSMLFIGGTASILGQQSRHDGDLDRQLEETCLNIAAVIQQARQVPIESPLATLQSARVHLRDATDARVVRILLDEKMPNAEIELVQAPLCRRELLVEIEGVAAC